MPDKTLLLVDDDPNILKALKRLLHRENYTVLHTNGGSEALQILEQNQVNVIISDHRMPMMTGVEFLAKVKELYPDITRIVLSGYSDIDTITEAINEGNIYKFIAKPWDDEQIKTTVKEAFEQNFLRLENSRLADELTLANSKLLQQNKETLGFLEQVVNHNSDGIVIVDKSKKVIYSNPSALTLLLDHYWAFPGDEFKLPFKEGQSFQHRLPSKNTDDILLQVHCTTITYESKQAFLITLHDDSSIDLINVEKKRSDDQLKQFCYQIVNAVSSTIEQRDSYLTGHHNRVARLAVAIGTKMELNDAALLELKIGGLVHDIGNIFIPSELFNNATTFNEENRLSMQQHTAKAYEIISNIEFPWPVAEIILQHNENIDGSGYPYGLSGNEIKLESKVMAVANAVCSMSEKRPYRNKLPVKQIIDIIKQESSTKFDPEIVDICIELLQSEKFDLKTSDKVTCNK